MPDEKTTAALTHALGILTLFIGPLAMYFIFRGKASPWLREHLDESLNYRLLVLVALVLCVTLAIVFTSAIDLPTISLIAFLLLFVFLILNVIFSIIAIIRAMQAKPYHYPLDIKMIR